MAADIMLLGAGIVVAGGAYGLGKIGSHAMDAIARQPEAAGKIQTAMIIIGALVEGLALAATTNSIYCSWVSINSRFISF